MRIIGRGIIPKSPDNIHLRSNTFPSIEKLPSGRWLAAFKAAEIKGDCPFQHAVITWSDDEGVNWQEPFEPVRMPDIDGVPGLSRIAYFVSLGGSRVMMVTNWMDASDMSLPYYNPENESLKDTRIFVSFSENEGESWSVPELMLIPDVHGPVPLTGPPLRLNDGTLICQFEINKYDWDASPWIHRSAMVFSYDGGRTWRDTVLVTEEKNMYYWDQRPNVLSDGISLVDFFWTLDGRKEAYINIHARQSNDGGKSWGALYDTGIYGQPGQPIDLGDGRLATISIDRSSSPVITVRTSRDFGHTYDEGLVVYERDKLERQDSRDISMNDAWAEMSAFSVGHPALLKLTDSEMLAYYYAGDHTDRTSIEFVRIAFD
jgi:hypothetical protein